jgi:Domain of unknown function (DUF6471)
MVMLNIVVNDKNIEYNDFYIFIDEGRVMTDSDWQERAKGLLKAELKKRGLGYKQLAEKLREIGVEENDRNLANKLARGGFSAVFLMQCLTAIGCHTLHLDA